MGEAAALPGSATASVPDLAKLPPPPAAELPKDATPVAGLPASVTPVVELPSAPTPAVTYDGGFLSWVKPFEILLGGGPRLTRTGLSINEAAPHTTYVGDNAFSLRTSVLVTPKTWGALEYHTQPFVFGQVDGLGGSLGELWSVGVGAAFRLAYPTELFALVVAPDLAASLGILWMKEPADVGAGDRYYWAYTDYKFPQLHAGMGVYADVPLQKWTLTAGLRSGMRRVWHESNMSPLAGQSKTVVGLQPWIMEALQFVLGGRF